MSWGSGHSKGPSVPGFRTRVVELAIILGCTNIGAWIWAFVAFHGNSILLGTALLAYSLGLRHAVDADHIAAIDNVTRKLVQEGRRPILVGFFFSLGHATIVVIGSLIAYSTALVAEVQFSWIKAIGAVLGTSVSAGFLIVIALVNLIILGRLCGNFRALRDGRAPEDQSQDILSGGGLLTRFLRPILRMLSNPWQMYPVGFLFGLGFDTTTEIAMLGISAAAGTKGLSLSAMAVFPLLFAVGMTLVDTADGILMVSAYGWAFVKPDRKLYYNFTITIVSAVVALVIGGTEAIGLLKDQLKLSGRLWDYVDNVISSFGAIGFATIFLFVAIWLGSIAFSRMKGLREV
jgi:high-affinity nickel-transport protein